MMCVMMWATGTMETMTLATTQAKGMARMLAERGGGLLVEDAAAVVGAAGTAAVVAAAYCRGRRECNIPVSSKKWAQRSGKEAIRVIEYNTVLHFIIMGAVKNCNSTFD
jgi:hypothetical protein